MPVSTLIRLKWKPNIQNEQKNCIENKTAHSNIKKYKNNTMSFWNIYDKTGTSLNDINWPI